MEKRVSNFYIPRQNDHKVFPVLSVNFVNYVGDN